MSARVPVVLVSGFLGSGKTTLVRHLLADARRRGLRVAVISNELSELGIDRALLADAGDDAIELAGGCICCRLSDRFVETLELLHERARPQRVIVETSGVALPYETQLQLWREPVSRCGPWKRSPSAPARPPRATAGTSPRKSWIASSRPGCSP